MVFVRIHPYFIESLCTSFLHQIDRLSQMSKHSHNHLTVNKYALLISAFLMGFFSHSFLDEHILLGRPRERVIVNAAGQIESVANGCPACAFAPRERPIVFDADRLVYYNPKLTVEQILDLPLVDNSANQKLTVIVGAWRRPQFMEEMIDALIAQTYPIEEIWVVAFASPTDVRTSARRFICIRCSA